MERLSVTTAITGLIAVSNRVMDMLWNLNTAPEMGTASIDNILQEVKQYRSSIFLLHKTLVLLESGQLPFPERGAWVEVDNIIAMLTDTVLAMSELQDLCNTIEAHQDTSDPEVVVLGEFEQIVSKLAARIRWHNLSITMMMTILNCPSDVDAENSKLGLEKRMGRLLSSNSALASRMRSLRDVLNTRGIATDIPPHYTPAVQYIHTLRTPPQSNRNSDSSIGPQRWSALSGHALADIPVPTAVALPVTNLELRDGVELYTSAFAHSLNGDLSKLIQKNGILSGEELKNVGAVVVTQSAKDKTLKQKRWPGLMKRFSRRKSNPCC